MAKASRRAELVGSIASTIADYRQGEITTPDADHVERWITQFDAAVQEPMLAELDHVLKRDLRAASQRRAIPRYCTDGEEARWRRPVQLLEEGQFPEYPGWREQPARDVDDVRDRLAEDKERPKPRRLRFGRRAVHLPRRRHLHRQSDQERLGRLDTVQCARDGECARSRHRVPPWREVVRRD